MKRSYLEMVYFKKKNSRFIKKIKKTKELLQQALQKMRGKNISKVLIQEGSVIIKVFGKIFNLFSL